ncbi:Oidioi.mRNA.OKI2018_I69.chr1.g1177.t1.cds [Oikopleura dioica]|uniref:Hexosyltransferase n=1 Tax=Oikopleura dioica TaxID=34765 RepID=A0ABN7SMM9_OIKDI|nr:Oidioi.mRNA.OKI2018_I69.chr1.g1177.t1.cds [Oikopleura dioica]
MMTNPLLNLSIALFFGITFLCIFDRYSQWHLSDAFNFDKKSEGRGLLTQATENDLTHDFLKTWSSSGALISPTCGGGEALESGIGGQLELTLAIKSSPKNLERREAIRATWGNQTLFPTRRAQLVFLVGRDVHPQSDRDLTLLKEEAAKSGDLLVGNFADTFRNLSQKDALLLTWLATCSYQSRFVFKGDDDIFLNRFLLDELLDLYKEKADSELLIGSILRGGEPVRDPESKKTAKSLHSQLMKMQPISVDDALIGLAMNKLGLSGKLRNNRGFKSWGERRSENALCDLLQLVTFHSVTPDQLLDFWRRMTDVPKLVDQCSFNEIPRELLSLDRSRQL